MRAMKAYLSLSLSVLLIACTPAFTEQQGKDLAGRARLLDSIDVERTNQRLLSRQAQICLVSDTTNTPSGQALLRSMQSAFGGYFVAVGVENEAMDYLRAQASAPCPGASYLFYIQPQGQPVCSGNAESCDGGAYSQVIITIVNLGDHSLADRVKFSAKKSFLPLEKNDQIRLQKAFEQLAVELTGAR